MRFSTSAVVATLALGSTVSAQLPTGASNVIEDIQELTASLIADRSNPAAFVGDVSAGATKIVIDAVNLAPGTAANLPDGGTALVNQVTTVVCPQLRSIENQLSNLPFPLNLVRATVFGAIKSVAQQFLTAVRALPSTGPVNTAPAVACLQDVIQNAN